MINPSNLSGHCCRQHGFLVCMWKKKKSLLNRVAPNNLGTEINQSLVKKS